VEAFRLIRVPHALSGGSGASRRSLVVCALIALFATAALHAADTGTISGIVLDRDGNVIADAIVRVTGDRLPGERTAQTGVNGSYRIEYLLPGEYLVTIDKPGIGSSRRTAVVSLGGDTQVDMVLGLTVSEQVAVVAGLPPIDTRSSEVSFNFTADAIKSLPLERNYRGLFQLIPGVGDNRSLVGPAAGGNRQDNTYLIDGANITNPGFGYLGTDVNELDIAEINLKRAGITAEFGRTAGTVTNAVSRSGSNRFETIARLDWLPTGLVAGYKLPDDLLALGVKPGAFRDQLLTTEAGAAVGVGGPIARDHAFFYGSARVFERTKWDRVNKVGVGLPDEVRNGSEVYGKVTAAPADAHQLTATYRHRPSSVNDVSLTSDYAPTAGSDSDNGSRVGTAAWAFFIGPRASFDVRYLHLKETNEDVPATDLGYLPTFDPQRLDRMGQYTDPAQANLTVGGTQFANIQNYRRHEIRGVVSRFSDIGRMSHNFKAGFGYEFGEEHFNRLANGWGIIANVVQGGVPALRARYHTPQPPQFGQGHTWSMFFQDAAALGSRASINAGVLLNRDSFAQRLDGSGGCPAGAVTGGAAVYESNGDTCTFLRFGFADEVQPRLGFSYQLRAGKGDKAYVNWGRYYNMDQKSTARSLAPYRIFQTQTFFDLNGRVLSSGPLASTTGKRIDPELQPIYTDEILVGYETPLSPLVSVDVFFMARGMHNFIEDIPSRVNGTSPDAGPFVAANLPCRAYAACRDADARRTYRAATIDLQRRLAGKWMGNVSYTWSRFEGNFDLDYSTSSVFNTSSFIQDAPGTNVEDPNRFGPLFEDRPHVFKVFSSYAVDPRLTLSGYLRVQSGTPWAARARDWAGSTLNYLEPAGTHRNPTWTNLDLMATYRLPLRGRAAVSFEARAMNVLDAQTRLSTDAQQYLDFRSISTPPYFAPYQDPNPFFGTGNAFAPPRRLNLSVTFSY
jgi:hypothetical protein